MSEPQHFGDHNYDRRASDRVKYDSKVRHEIMEQLSEIEDPSYRVMLTILLKVQDELVSELSGTQLMMQGYMSRIAQQLEKLNKSKDQLREEVLNGHADHHHDDHEYIKELRKQDVMCGLVLRQHGEDGLCEHARQMLEEKEVAKRRKWKVQDMITMGLVLILIATLFPNVAQYFK